MRVGDRVAGEWLLERRIGHGGMAEVFLARSTRTNGSSTVRCIKALVAEYALDDSLVQKMLDEGRLGMALTEAECPNIVRVFDFGKEGPQPWILMEYVDGADCGAVVDRDEALSDPDWVAVVAHIGRRVLEPLRFAQSMTAGDGQPLGLIHRDLSPQNIFLARNGVVKVGDFGVARSALQSQKTVVAVARGKHGYIAPEQYAGKTLDASTDLFALGVVLFQLLVGDLPFHADSPALMEAMIKDGTRPRLRDRRPDVPEEMESIIDRMLVPTRIGRFADHTAGIEAFLRVERGHDVPGAIRRIVAHCAPWRMPIDVASEREADPRAEFRRHELIPRVLRQLDGEIAVRSPRVAVRREGGVGIATIREVLGRLWVEYESFESEQAGLAAARSKHDEAVAGLRDACARQAGEQSVDVAMATLRAAAEELGVKLRAVDA